VGDGDLRTRALRTLHRDRDPGAVWGVAMRGDFRRYWRESGYWLYLARNHANGLRAIGLTALGLLIAVGGYAASQSLSEPQVLTAERLVTVRKVVDGKVVTTIERQVVTLKEPGTTQTQTDLVTVVRNGRTITIPAKTILRTDTVTGPTITNTRTRTETDTETQRETQTNTETQTQTEIQTHTSERVTTETEQRDVPGPERTTTETQTQTQTETETGPTTTLTETETETQTRTETETDTDTVTVTETETVTEPAP
jgi:hypothetical protein